jgi:hypothetical protein
MQHKLTVVAQTHHFDQNKFLNFAAQNIEKYGIVHQHSPMQDVWIDLPREDWSVSTYNVDDLVQSFKITIGN